MLHSLNFMVHCRRQEKILVSTFLLLSYLWCLGGVWTFLWFGFTHLILGYISGDMLRYWKCIWGGCFFPYAQPYARTETESVQWGRETGGQNRGDGKETKYFNYINLNWHRHLVYQLVGNPIHNIEQSWKLLILKHPAWNKIATESFTVHMPHTQSPSISLAWSLTEQSQSRETLTAHSCI